jgi:hypothetical protein
VPDILAVERITGGGRKSVSESAARILIKTGRFRLVEAPEPVPPEPEPVPEAAEPSPPPDPAADAPEAISPPDDDGLDDMHYQDIRSMAADLELTPDSYRREDLVRALRRYNTRDMAAEE